MLLVLTHDHPNTQQQQKAWESIYALVKILYKRLETSLRNSSNLPKTLYNLLLSLIYLIT